MFVFLLALGCTRTTPPVTAGDSARSSSQATPTCETLASVEVRTGQTCRVVGRLEVKPFFLKGGSTLSSGWPVVVLRDGTEVMVESVWARVEPNPSVIEPLSGESVEVEGILSRSPPNDSPENFYFWCISETGQSLQPLR